MLVVSLQLSNNKINKKKLVNSPPINNKKIKINLQILPKNNKIKMYKLIETLNDNRNKQRTFIIIKWAQISKLKRITNKMMIL